MNKNIMRKQSGFTLMEILFVVLVIALVISFAMPAIRSVRFDIKNSRTKAAIKKVAEARRSYYEATRGGTIKKILGEALIYSGNATAMKKLLKDPCTAGASGVPGTGKEADVGQLFVCGFLDWKEFVDLPYEIKLCDGNEVSATPATDHCGVVDGGEHIYVSAYTKGTYAKDAGEKYSNGYYMYITLESMEVRDNEGD